MKEAYRLYSWNGILAEQMSAIDVSSKSDARKLGPFFDEEKEPVLWVDWATNPNSPRKVKPYFRHYPKRGTTSLNREHSLNLVEENAEREKAKEKDDIHNKARDEMVATLKDMINKRTILSWAYSDKRVSDFSLSGNLLSDVVDVVSEYTIDTPLGFKYRFDIALLGKKIYSKPIILGAIELENTHRFEMVKTLVCKSLGFPLMSINISENTLDDINQAWCIRALQETTKYSKSGIRHNYIYIHYSLYPVYMDLPSWTRHDKTRHQYIVFVDDENFNKLFELLKKLQDALDIKEPHVLAQKQICTNSASLRILENEGSIAGTDWKRYNQDKYIRVNLDIPFEKSGALYKYHLALSSLLNSHFKTYVGYKYIQGANNYAPDEHVWTAERQEQKYEYSEELEWVTYRLLPKHVSEPLDLILEQLKLFGVNN